MILGDRKIGIEITNFYLKDGGDLRASSGSASCVVASYKRRTNSIALRARKGIELTVTFNSGVPVTPAACKTLPGQLADICGAEQAKAKRRPYYGDELPPEILRVWISSEDWPSPSWERGGQVYSVEEMALPRLSEIVAAKEAKAAEYQICDAYWLLVVVDWIDPAQEQEITTTKVTYHRVSTSVLLYTSRFLMRL